MTSLDAIKNLIENWPKYNLKCFFVLITLPILHLYLIFSLVHGLISHNFYIHIIDKMRLKEFSEYSAKAKLISLQHWWDMNTSQNLIFLKMEKW